MAASPPQINSSHLQQMLQSAVQTFQWTYGIFWQFCQQQGVLIWAEGYYNGDIKTRKTMQPSVEESSASALQRSQQLRELYFSLLAGESNQQPPVRRFCAALSPEDLTELEWFYLLCISFSFPPGVGLPGKSYEKGHYIWLTAADEVDSRIFSRSILAKSAHIQTVVCIPSMDGVVELGYTEIVQEDPSFIQQVKNIFTDHHRQHHDHYHNHDHHNPPLGVVPPPKSTFEMHSSTSLSASTNELNFPLVPMYAIPNPPPLPLNKVAMEDEGVCDEFDANDSNLDLKSSQQLGLEGVGPTHVDQIDPGELLQLELLDDIERLSSPDYASDNLDSDFRTMGKSIDHSSQLSHHQVESFQDVDFVRKNSNGLQHHHQHEGLLVGKDWKCSGDASPLDSLTCQHQEDSHYTQILSTILQSQPSSTTSTATSPALSWHLSFSPNSVFSKWTAYEPTPCYRPVEGTSQSLLKYTLFTRPSLHSKHRPGPSKLYELSTSHVMAERRRREKLNERFIILRSLVPFVTKMDKASILGDTIEYLKHLRSKIQELEARERRRELERGEIWGRFEKRKVRVVDGRSEGGILKAVEAMEGDNKLEVSIIERDALVEMHCQHEEGLLLDVMLTLRDLRLEVTAVQSSLHDGYLAAELRAKVKETGNGRRASIMEVKRAVKQIMPDRDS